MSDPLQQNRSSTTFDNQLIELESVDSTNNYAMGRIHEGLASDGLVCLAHHQTAGKGQRGRGWLSAPGKNLMISLVIEPSPLDLNGQFLFSAAVALGIIDLVSNIHPGFWRIKWPNDIYFNDRKAAGILIESVIRGSIWPFAVVGIGMNLNQEKFPAAIPNAISLKQITGIHHKPIDIARLLVPAIQHRIAILKQDQKSILADFNRLLYKMNEPISLKKGEDRLLTRLKGVDEQGYLITENGSFALGEVEMIIGR